MNVLQKPLATKLVTNPIPTRYTGGMVNGWLRMKASAHWMSIIFMLAITGCASTDSADPSDSPTPSNRMNTDAPLVVSYDDYQDPLIGINRTIFRFNDFTYRYALIPASRGYTAVVPANVRAGVARAFNNIASPVSAVNNMLQGKPGDSLKVLARFGINTTLGLLGFFDPAENLFDLSPAPTGFNDTLTQWGSGYGFYIVLPLAGPADLRNGIGQAGDYFLNPLVHLTSNPDRTLLMGYGAFNNFAPNVDSYLELREETDDLYSFMRNMYLQNLRRNAEFAGE